MIYIFDCSPLIVLFKHFYPDRFPTLWEKFELLINDQIIISVREVYNEINTYGNVDRLVEWAKDNQSFFPLPAIEELEFVTEIFKVNHFQNLIRKKERLQGKPVADPFVIAKAKINKGCVVTQEEWRENSAKIPNVCEHFGIPCMNLEEFMQKENWTF
ncbi:MAG: PIN domain-containing protein [bacterium]